MKQQHWYNDPRIRLLQHLLFIGFSYFLLLQIFKIGARAQWVDHVYTTLFLASILPVVYINLMTLLPRLSKTLRWYVYGLLLLASLVFFVWINTQLFNNWSAYLFKNLFFISYYNWWETVSFFIAFIVITSLLKLSKSWFAINDLQQRLLAIEKQKVDMELLALKAQVNPHFFFNTLNSIYSLSLDKDARLPSAVLQLSGIMRYYLYESKDERVSLEKELKILQDYIELQRIRSNEKLDMKMHIDGDIAGKKIAPLILITFVENAFKHGAKGGSGNPFIHLNIVTKENELYFTLSNNKGTVDDIELKEYNGIGLENVRRRLSLLYPNKHRLNIHDEADQFTVELKMNVQ